jgi:hypothetical protein
MRSKLRQHPLAASAVAIGLAAVAVLVIARATGADAVGRAFADFNPGWLALLAGASLLTYPAYVLAYRSIAHIHGHAPLALPLVARVVVAGFGPFAITGGFGLDQQALHALHEDERSARVRVLALGVLEWAVLAPIACAVSIVCSSRTRTSCTRCCGRGRWQSRPGLRSRCGRAAPRASSACHGSAASPASGWPSPWRRWASCTPCSASHGGI